jgi:hypothetical protein
MLEFIVLLDRRRIGQVKHVACFNQAIDEPVPVVGRLHNDAGEFLSIGDESRAYRTQIVGQSLEYTTLSASSETTTKQLLKWRSMPQNNMPFSSIKFGFVP